MSFWGSLFFNLLFPIRFEWTARHKSIQSEAAWPDDAPIFVHRDCNAHVPDGCRQTPDLHSGRIFAVASPTDCEPEIRFMAGLVGGLLATKGFVESKGQRGAAIAFKPGIHTKRQLFFTPAFMAKYRGLCLQVCEVLQLQDCKWQLLSRAGLQEAIDKLNVSRARQLLILRADSSDEVFAQVKLNFTLNEAIQHFAVCQEDKSRSRTGISAQY